jgi:hypothetical protein
MWAPRLHAGSLLLRVPCHQSARPEWAPALQRTQRTCGLCHQQNSSGVRSATHSGRGPTGGRGMVACRAQQSEVSCC